MSAESGVLLDYSSADWGGGEEDSKADGDL